MKLSSGFVRIALAILAASLTGCTQTRYTEPKLLNHEGGRATILYDLPHNAQDTEYWLINEIADAIRKEQARRGNKVDIKILIEAEVVE